MKKLAYSACIAILCIMPLVAAGTAGAGGGPAGTTLGADEVSGVCRGQDSHRDHQCLGRAVAAGRGLFECCHQVPRADCWGCCRTDYDACISDGTDAKYCKHMYIDVCSPACDTCADTKRTK